MSKKVRLDNIFRVGDVLYGYCEGYFGRDSYDEKTVEAVGHDWMIVRENKHPVALLEVPDGIEAMAIQWQMEPTEGD